MSKDEPVLCQRTFALGQQRWRVDHNENWSTYMWGWWPDSNGTPSGRFVPVDKDKVPHEILVLATP